MSVCGAPVCQACNQSVRPTLPVLQTEHRREKDKFFCRQDAAFRTFFHDITGAVPVCVVLPPSVWQAVEALIENRCFRSAGAQACLRVGLLTLFLLH